MNSFKKHIIFLKGSWKQLENQREMLDSVSKKLQIKNWKEWYRVTKVLIFQRYLLN